MDAAGFVLAGGRSSRMGADKALLEFCGEPLIARALGILRNAGLTAAIAGGRSPLDGYAPVVPDAEPGRGPLGGICAVLHTSRPPMVVFLPVDMPLLPSSLIDYLHTHARTTGKVVTLASVNGVPQPFPSVIHRDALPALENELRAGRAGCFAAFQVAARSLGQVVSVLPVELLVQSGHITHSDSLPPSQWFLNLNSPRDLERAAACLAVQDRVS